MSRQAFAARDPNETKPGEKDMDQVPIQSSTTWRELALKASRSGLELGSYP